MEKLRETQKKTLTFEWNIWIKGKILYASGTIFIEMMKFNTKPKFNSMNCAANIVEHWNGMEKHRMVSLRRGKMYIQLSAKLFRIKTINGVWIHTHTQINYKYSMGKFI